MRNTLKHMFCAVLLLLTVQNARAGWFDFLYEMDVTIKMDDETQKAVNRAIGAAERIDATFVRLPHEMQQAMLPVIREASRELEHAFKQGVDHLNQSLMELVDMTFNDLERVMENTLIKAQEVIDYTLDEADSRAEVRINQAGEILDDFVHEAEGAGKRLIEDADRRAAIRLDQAKRAMENIVREANIEMGKSIDRLKVSGAELITAAERSGTSLIDRVFVQSHQLHTKADETIVRMNDGLYIVLDNFGTTLRYTAGEFRRSIEDAVLGAQAIPSMLGNEGVRVVQAAGDTAKGVMDKGEYFVSYILVKGVVYGCIMLLLLLGYKAASLQMEGRLASLNPYQMGLLGTIGTVFLVLAFWQQPIRAAFGMPSSYEEPMYTRYDVRPDETDETMLSSFSVEEKGTSPAFTAGN